MLRLTDTPSACSFSSCRRWPSLSGFFRAKGSPSQSSPSSGQLGYCFRWAELLDFFLVRYFFVFPNPAATIGIKAPALGGGVPIEEYVFYLTGFVAALLLYIWLDEYWLAAYSVDAKKRITFDRLLRFHPYSFGLACVLISAAFLYQRYVLRIPGRFPGYFICLVLFALLPSTALLPAAPRHQLASAHLHDVHAARHELVVGSHLSVAVWLVELPRGTNAWHPYYRLVLPAYGRDLCMGWCDI